MLKKAECNAQRVPLMGSARCERRMQEKVFQNVSRVLATIFVILDRTGLSAKATRERLTLICIFEELRGLGYVGG